MSDNTNDLKNSAEISAITEHENPEKEATSLSAAESQPAKLHLFIKKIHSRITPVFQAVSRWKQKHGRRAFLVTEFLCFAVITLLLWFVLIRATGHKITEHNVYDQHTRMARAWRKGQNHLDEGVGHLELVYLGDKTYVSFPPVPTLIELPFTLFAEQNTPNTLVQCLAAWLAMLLGFFILLKLTGNRLFSYFGTFAFFWGSNILYLSLAGAVWHQGHIYAVFFTVLSFFILLYATRKFHLIFGAFALALAVGCRPLNLIFALFFLYKGYKRFPSKLTIVFILAGMAPPGIFYAIYNFFRFGSPFEFGHKYLPWAQTLETGIFGLRYVVRNFKYAMFHLPLFIREQRYLAFDGMGTAIWFTSPIILSGFVYFFRRKIHWLEKIIAGLSFAGVWFMLLQHESNGFFQFGYRYIVDVVPILLYFFGAAYKKNSGILTAVGMYSIILNVYGSVWFYTLRQF